MKALIFDQHLSLSTTYPKPITKKGEALIKVLQSGICNTDIEITKGYMGFKGILGHEFVGIIESVDHDDQFLAGKRVVGEINANCGTCPYCLKGLPTHCPHRSVLGILNRDGCFAEYLTLPTTLLHIIPDSIPNEDAVFVEPLAAAFQIMEQLHLKPTQTVAVLGDGKLGLLISQVLNLSHANIIAIGKHAHKLAILQKQGIETLLLENVPVEPTYDVVVDATGSINGFELAMNIIKPRGTLVLKSTVAATASFSLAPIVINEITVLGSRCGPFNPAINALKNKAVDVKSLITQIYPFDQALDAFSHASTPGTMKILLKH